MEGKTDMAHLNGITVLSEEQIFGAPGWVSTLQVILLVAMFIFFASSMVSAGAEKRVISGILATIAVILGVSLIVIAIIDPQELKYVQYYITLSEDVSAADFINTYDVMQQKGDLWIVRFK